MEPFNLFGLIGLGGLLTSYGGACAPTVHSAFDAKGVARGRVHVHWMEHSDGHEISQISRPFLLLLLLLLSVVLPMTLMGLSFDVSLLLGLLQGTVSLVYLSFSVPEMKVVVCAMTCVFD